MKITHVQEMRDLDRVAIEKYGIPDELLMENAGDAAYFVIQKEFGIFGKKYVIFCGGGNNGGDGLVVARKIHSNGGKAVVVLLSDPAKYQNAAKLNYKIVQKLPIKIILLEDVEKARTEIQQANVIVDAIFGTGLDREVKGIYRAVIEEINASAKPVFSLDIPSGVNGETGQVMGIAVKADFTTTFGLPKIGNMLYPGFELGGKLYVTHISFPFEHHHQPQLKINLNSPQPLKPRNEDSHKGSYGKALFIAGSMNYFGAPYFAAMSFLKAGGGLSYLATPDCAVPAIASQGNEIIFIPQGATGSGSIALSNKSALLDFVEGVDFVVIGPGLSLNKETQRLIRELVQEINKPLLIDGDGISAIAHEPEILSERTKPTILTPHPGEMARLMNLPVSEIGQARIPVLEEAVQSMKCHIVLKGAHSLIGVPDGDIYINLSGNAGMATAGSGDVLTGAIAAMFGSSGNFENAIRQGVFMHGLAGDLAAQEIGTDGLIAGDIMNFLPVALKTLREDFENVTKDYYGKVFVI